MYTPHIYTLLDSMHARLTYIHTPRQSMHVRGYCMWVFDYAVCLFCGYSFDVTLLFCTLLSVCVLVSHTDGEVDWAHHCTLLSVCVLVSHVDGEIDGAHHRVAWFCCHGTTARV